jgi:hypothetical protein
LNEFGEWVDREWGIDTYIHTQTRRERERGNGGCTQVAPA